MKFLLGFRHAIIHTFQWFKFAPVTFLNKSLSFSIYVQFKSPPSVYCFFKMRLAFATILLPLVLALPVHVANEAAGVETTARSCLESCLEMPERRCEGRESIPVELGECPANVR